MKLFSGADIDAIMNDIEGLDLPVEYNFGVLRIVLDAVEIHGCAPEVKTNIVFDEMEPISDLPEFLKNLAAHKLKAKMQVARDARENSEPESPAPPPQAAFSPAPELDAAPKKPEATPAHGVRWTKEEEEVLIKGRLQGKPFKELAELLGRKERTCASKMHWLTENHAGRIERIKAKVEPESKRPATPMYEQGPWTLEEENRLLEMRNEGAMFKVIALKLNRPVKGVTQKFYNLRDAAAPDLASKAEGGKGFLPRPCPDENWPIEDDLELVSEHHSGLPMLDVSIILERPKKDCVARYKALIEAMPAGSFTERQIKLKQTLAHHAHLARKAA